MTTLGKIDVWNHGRDVGLPRELCLLFNLSSKKKTDVSLSSKFQAVASDISGILVVLVFKPN